MATILQINTVVNTGSTGRIAEEIGLLAIKNGWESYIAYGRNETTSESKLIKIGNDFELKFHGLLTRLFDMHGLGSKGATQKLIERIEDIKPDIIHLHNLHGYYLNIKVLFNYLARKDIPIVWTLHDCWPMTGHCAYFDYVGCEKWKKLCYSCPQKDSYPSSFVVDRSRENYLLKQELFTTVKNLTIVPVSNWLGRIVKDSFLSVHATNVICNGVDTELFNPDKATTKNKSEKFTILGVANIWEERKGLSVFLELSKKLDSNCQIILVGLDSKQIKKLPNNITGISRTENINELAKIYANADVFVNPSVEETFGLTTAEALSSGTPVIVYNATASPELVTNETGFVVDKGNIEEFVDAINIIKGKGKNYYSSSCRKRALKNYNKKERYSDYIDMYRSLLARYNN
ncbi:glycosyltransferase [Marinifilum fragile]|uniref:glycosyltransferase n=1 Tax=Marinifilum fragile TaxID=570161 RepID=UPI002AAC1B43|nr:glycosyltransferase [Marinifilum fragile]